MPHILHLIKDPSNRTAFEVVAQQARDPAITLSVVLLQEAVHVPGPLPGKVYRLDEGRRNGSSGSPYPSITHSRLLDLIFAADTVVTW